MALIVGTSVGMGSVVSSSLGRVEMFSRNVSDALMFQVVSNPETSVSIYHTTRLSLGISGGYCCFSRGVFTVRCPCRCPCIVLFRLIDMLRCSSSCSPCTAKHPLSAREARTSFTYRINHQVSPLFIPDICDIFHVTHFLLLNFLLLLSHHHLLVPLKWRYSRI